MLEDVGIYLSTMSIMTLILEFLLVSGYGEPSVLCSQQEVVAVNSSDGDCWRRVAFCNCTHFFGHEWDCKVSWVDYNIIKTGYLNLEGIGFGSGSRRRSWAGISLCWVRKWVLNIQFHVHIMTGNTYYSILREQVWHERHHNVIHWHVPHSIVSTVIAGHQKLLDLFRFSAKPASLIQINSSSSQQPHKYSVKITKLWKFIGLVRCISVLYNPPNSSWSWPLSISPLDFHFHFRWPL